MTVGLFNTWSNIDFEGLDFTETLKIEYMRNVRKHDSVLKARSRLSQ